MSFLLMRLYLEDVLLEHVSAFEILLCVCGRHFRIECPEDQPVGPYFSFRG